MARRGFGKWIRIVSAALLSCGSYLLAPVIVALERIGVVGALKRRLVRTLGHTSFYFRTCRSRLFFLDKSVKKAKTTLNPLSQSLAGFKTRTLFVQGMNPFWDRQNTGES
jgi:hypothetical protein